MKRLYETILRAPFPIGNILLNLNNIHKHLYHSNHIYKSQEHKHSCKQTCRQFEAMNTIKLQVKL